MRPERVLQAFERVELLEDFGARRDGAEIALLSRAFSGMDMTGSINLEHEDGGMMRSCLFSEAPPSKRAG
jgi:hypothetical protein